MTTLLMVRDAAGQNTFGLKPPSVGNRFSGVLATNTHQSITVPNESASGNYLAIFAAPPGVSFWVAYNGDTVAVPIGAMASTTSEHMPSARQVVGGSTMNVITSNTTDVQFGVTFHEISL